MGHILRHRIEQLDTRHPCRIINRATTLGSWHIKMYWWDESTCHLMVGPYQRVLITSYSPSSHDCISGRTGVVHSCSAANWHGFHVIAHQFDRHMHWRWQVPCNSRLSNLNTRQAYLPHDESGKLLGNTPACLCFKPGVISSACEKIWLAYLQEVKKSISEAAPGIVSTSFQAFALLNCWILWSLTDSLHFTC